MRPLEPVQAPPPIPRAPAVRRDRRRRDGEQPDNNSDAPTDAGDQRSDDDAGEYTIDEYA